MVCEHSIVMKKGMCLGTFSRSIFIVWKRSFLYDKKEYQG